MHHTRCHTADYYPAIIKGKQTADTASSPIALPYELRQMHHKDACTIQDAHKLTHELARLNGLDECIE